MTGKWFGPGLAVAVALMLGATLSGCGGTPGPEDTVQRYFDAVSARDSARLAKAFIPEVGEGMRQATLPGISIENLKIEKISETEDTSEVIAEYDAEIAIGERPTQTHAKVRFTLTKTDGEWLISNAEAEGVQRNDDSVLGVPRPDSSLLWSAVAP